MLSNIFTRSKCFFKPQFRMTARKRSSMNRTVSKTHELSLKMDEIVRRMNRGEMSAEDAVRQLFPMALQSFVEASQECEQISQSLDEIEGHLLEARTMTQYLFEFVGQNKLLDEFQLFMEKKNRERIN